MSNIVFVIMSGPGYESSVEGVVSGRREAIDVCETLNADYPSRGYYVDEFLVGSVAAAGDRHEDHLISGYATWSEYDEAVVAEARQRELRAAREREDRNKEYTRKITEAFDKERARVKTQTDEQLALANESFQLVKRERGASKVRKRAAKSLRIAVLESSHVKYSEIRDRELAAIDAALAERDAANIS